MPRRAAAGVRPLDPDALHGSRLVQQVINKVMLDGKKSTSERIVYEALDILSRRTNKEPVESLESSVKALTPSLERSDPQRPWRLLHVNLAITAIRSWLAHHRRPRTGVSGRAFGRAEGARMHDAFVRRRR